MQDYKSYQRNLIIIISLCIIMLWIFIAWYFKVGRNPIPLQGMFILEIAAIIILSMFHGLTISISDKKIILKFGIGIFNKTINLSEVSETKLVKNKWYYGWGIRIIPHGMLYNAHGLNAVELKFKNKNRIIRIGSSNTQELKQEIDKRINSD